MTRTKIRAIVARLGTLLAVALASLLLSLVAAEMAIRAYLYGIEVLWPPMMESIAPIGTSGLIRASDRPGVVYELRPNLNTLFKKAALRTNAQGMRDREYEPRKPPGTIRAAVLGDSFTMPSGVELADAYHKLLENDLTRSAGGARFEFLNFGVAGYQLEQYVAVLEQKALAYDLDLVVVGFSPNDFIDLHANMPPGPYHVLPTSHPFFEIHALPFLQKTMRQRAAAAKAPTMRPGAQPDPTAPPGEPVLAREARAYILEHLDAIQALTEPRGIAVLVAYLDTFTRGSRDLVAFLAKACAERGFLFVDTSTSFGAVQDPAHRIYRDDAHPNAAANRVFAERLRESLAGSGVLARIQAEANARMLAGSTRDDRDSDGDSSPRARAAGVASDAR